MGYLAEKNNIEFLEWVSHRRVYPLSIVPVFKCKGENFIRTELIS